MANMAYFFICYIYSRGLVDQTLKIKLLTFCFLLPKCHSVNMSSWSPKANLARVQGWRIKNFWLQADSVKAHLLPPEQTFPLKEYFHAGLSAAQHQALLPQRAPSAMWCLSVPGSEMWLSTPLSPIRTPNMVLMLKFTSTCLNQKHII